MRFDGINKADPKQLVGQYEATDGLNFRLNKNTCGIREGTVDFSSGWSGTDKKRVLWNVRDTLIAVGSTIDKNVSGVWTTAGISGFSGSGNPVFLEFPCVTNSAASATGTITDVLSNGYGISDSSKSFTENQYVNYFLKITSGNGNGQIRMITLNSPIDINVSEAFTMLPTVGDSYSILAKTSSGNYFFCSGETPRKNENINTTTWVGMSGTPQFKQVINYKNRAVGFIPGTSKLYISSYMNAEEFPYQIDVDEGNNSDITGLGVIGSQLVVHKGTYGGVWIYEFDDPTQASAQGVQRMEQFGALSYESIAVGENIMFYASSRGVEWFNTLETNPLEGHKCLSDFRIPGIGDDYNLDTAQGFCFNAKYYCFIESITDPGLTNDRVFIFDTAHYLQLYESGNAKPYCFLVDQGYPAYSFEELNGKLYVGGIGHVYEMSGTEDDGESIQSYWEKGGIVLGDPMRDKMIRKISLLSDDGELYNSIGITLSTEKQSKFLGTTQLKKDVINIDAKQTRGKQFNLRIDTSQIGSSNLNSLQFIYETGKL